MKTLATIFASLFIASAACAGEQHGGQHGKPGSDDRKTTQTTSVNQSARSESRAQSRAVSRSSSISTGGIATASGGAGGSAVGGAAVSSVGAMSFNFTAPPTSAPSATFVNHDYSGMPNNTPAMGNSYISTSNSCDGAVGISLALPGFGGGLSAAKLRMMCEGRLNAQAHKALGQEAKAQLTMEVVQEYACEEDSTWAKIARKKGLCAPADEATAVAQTNQAFNSK